MFLISIDICDERIIRNKQLILTSSTKNDNIYPWNARLSSETIWCPSENDTAPFVEIDLMNSHMVTAIVVRVGDHEGNYINTFEMKHGLINKYSSWKDHVEVGKTRVS